MNTALIIAQQTSDTPDGNFAAKVAADYSVQDDGKTACTGDAKETCYRDWYLPSKFELNLLHEHRVEVGGFVTHFYWSSSEGDSYNAWFQTFGNGDQSDTSKEYTLSVRAVRAF